MEHLPDAQGVKYHLQLNIYRFIIEKYYGYVSSMFVVCLHPELQDGPWVNEVPAMPAEICAIMQLRRDHIRRQGCGSPHISGTLPMDVSGGAANFAEDGAWNRFKLLRAVVFFSRRQWYIVYYISSGCKESQSPTHNRWWNMKRMKRCNRWLRVYIYIA